MARTRGACSVRGRGRASTCVHSGRAVTLRQSSENEDGLHDLRNVLHMERYNLLLTRGCATRRCFNWDAFKEENFGESIKNWIIEMGWLQLASLNVPSYPSLVAEFYASLPHSRYEFGGDYPENTTNLYARVKGIEMKISPTNLGEILGIPSNGMSHHPEDMDFDEIWKSLSGRDENFPYHARATCLKNAELRMLHHFIATTLSGKDGSWQVVTRGDLFLLWSIVNGKEINLPMIIIQRMTKVPRKNKGKLPFGMFVTEILKAYHIDLRGQPKKSLRKDQLYGASSLGRMFEITESGTWELAQMDSITNAAFEVGTSNEGGTAVKRRKKRKLVAGNATGEAGIQFPPEQWQVLKGINSQLSEISKSLNELKREVKELKREGKHWKHFSVYIRKKMSQSVSSRRKVSKPFCMRQAVVSQRVNTFGGVDQSLHDPGIYSPAFVDQSLHDPAFVDLTPDNIINEPTVAEIENVMNFLAPSADEQNRNGEGVLAS